MIDTSTLKYDRTQADSYEAADLNRIGEFIDTVITMAEEELQIITQMRIDYDVAENPYILPDIKVPTVQVKKDFDFADTYTQEEMEQYIKNIGGIVEAFPPLELKPLPQSMRFLTAEGANNIEYDLKGSAENLVTRVEKTKKYIKDTSAVFSYSGEIYAGSII